MAAGAAAIVRTFQLAELEERILALEEGLRNDHAG
jgi:hypothetical protein